MLFPSVPYRTERMMELGDRCEEGIADRWEWMCTVGKEMEQSREILEFFLAVPEYWVRWRMRM